MRKKKTIEYLFTSIENRPIRLLDHEYTEMKQKYCWACLTCNKKWKATAASVVSQQTGCPHCAGLRQTLSNIQKIAYSANFTLLSKNFVGVSGKYMWKCPDGHTWDATASHVKSGTGCPYCKSYITEEACRFIFQELTGCVFKKNRSILGTRLELDGYCDKLKIAFEYQGKQHYDFIKHLHRRIENHEAQKRRDDLKRSLCKEKQIGLLEIPYYVNDLEPFIREKLEFLNIKCFKTIDWSKFKGRVSMLEELQLAARKLDAECLSTVYINARSKMDFRCNKCDREWESTSNDIKNGYGCLKCGGKMKITLNTLQNRGENVGLKLLSKEYVNAKTKLNWQCLECKNILWRTGTDIQQGKGCPKCGRRKGRKKKEQADDLDRSSLNIA